MRSIDGPPVVEAQVTLNSLTTTTNDKGEFIFHSVKSGSHKISVSAGNFSEKSLILNVFKNFLISYTKMINC